MVLIIEMSVRLWKPNKASRYNKKITNRKIYKLPYIHILAQHSVLHLIRYIWLYALFDLAFSITKLIMLAESIPLSLLIYQASSSSLCGEVNLICSTGITST